MEQLEFLLEPVTKLVPHEEHQFDAFHLDRDWFFISEEPDREVTYFDIQSKSQFFA